jgi:4-hydroxy-2-oxoheptanedioate aldolase
MLLASRLRAGETVVTSWSGVPDALTVEIMTAQGFDAVTLDMQHGAHHEDSVVRCIPVILAAGRHAVVRIPIARWDMASRALDFGAEAVIAPMINSVEDARRFAAAMKYPPVGERSWGPTFALPRIRQSMPDYLAGANDARLAIAMIETRAALDVLDGILATPGIDGVFLGPSDFSIAWTNGARLDPTLKDMMQAVGDVAARARDAGKVAGIFVMDPAFSGRFAAMGYSLLAMGSEHRLIALGAEAMLKAVKTSLQG